MEIYTELPSQKILDRLALSVGTFDGVHCGHQRLIEALKREAAARGLPSAVLTFQDMPYCFFRPDDCPRLLTLPHEKIAAFEKLGIDHLFIVPFDKQVANQSYEEFATGGLRDRLGLELLVAGPDFALGKNRDGNLASLKTLGQKIGFETHVLNEKIECAGAPISSTRVRGCVEKGEVEIAAEMLGHAFSFEGEVVTGKQLGRTIGVPTINLKIHQRKVVPAESIYAARAFFDGESTPHAAALSIGTNPTVSEEDSIKIEFHVIDEIISVAPKTARLELVAWLRGEEKFDSLESLVSQMRNDIARAKTILT